MGPNGPPLYWHQDLREWNSPVAATPWPHQVFFSYYLTDTTRENGCLRVIPGSHVNWHPLHDILPNAHEQEIRQLSQSIDETSPVFAEAEGSIDVPMQAGDLIIGDARLLHSAWGNQTNERRTLVLAWYNCFHFPRAPSWWTEPIPPEIANADTRIQYRSSRTPNIPWKNRGKDFHAKWGAAYPSSGINKGLLGRKQVGRGMPAAPVEDASLNFNAENSTKRVEKDAEPSHVSYPNSPTKCHDTVSSRSDIACSVIPDADNTDAREVMTDAENTDVKEECEVNATYSRYWSRYKVLNGQGNWWWCELNEDWFFEDRPGPWVKYKDPDSGRLYWWKNDSK